MSCPVMTSSKLRELAPDNIRRYLLDAGWTCSDVDCPDRPFLIFSKDKECITLPKKDSYTDYARRVGEIVDTLSTTEQRCKREIYSDILSTIESEDEDIVRRETFKAVQALDDAIQHLLTASEHCTDAGNNCFLTDCNALLLEKRCVALKNWLDAWDEEERKIREMMG